MQKIYLTCLLSTLLAVTACSKQQTPEPTTGAEATSAEPTSVTAETEVAEQTPVVEASAEAGDSNCDTTIEANDAMKYNVDSITISKSCPTFTIHLKHVGNMAKESMGHNVVIGATSDMQNIVTDGIAATLDNNYVKPDDGRVIAHTKVIGGGEETEVSFDTSKLTGEGYKFFCSFPGHIAMMQGDVNLVD